MKLHKGILTVSVVLLTFIGLYSLFVRSHFIYDYIFSIVLLSVLYKSRKELNLSERHYGYICFLTIAHNFGVFGAYDILILGFSYDVFLHFFWGFVIGLAGFRYFKISKKYKDKRKYIAAFILLLLITLVHELIEYMGGRFFGEGEGVFFNGPGDADWRDPYDTAEDIINNILGGLLALFIMKRKEK